MPPEAVLEALSQREVVIEIRVLRYLGRDRFAIRIGPDAHVFIAHGVHQEAASLPAGAGEHGGAVLVVRGKKALISCAYRIPGGENDRGGRHSEYSDCDGKSFHVGSKKGGCVAQEGPALTMSGMGLCASGSRKVRDFGERTRRGPGSL